jgi:hypothetical protein
MERPKLPQLGIRARPVREPDGLTAISEPVAYNL